MSLAADIAARFLNRGDSAAVARVCLAYGAVIEPLQGSHTGLARYELPDASAVLIDDSSWVLEAELDANCAEQMSLHKNSN